MKKQLMFTLPMTTPNASQICEMQSGKVFETPQEFITSIVSQGMANEEDIIIYTVEDFVMEFNIGTVDDDSLNVATTYMGNITVKKM